LLGLGALGRAHRLRWSADSARPLVAITGSAGKTTTRVATAAVLRTLGPPVHASAGNLNNAVGIPVVLLGLEPAHALAVVEVGTSSRGEITHGASLCEPTVGVLTLVAAAHTADIGSVDDVAVEKGALLAALAPSGVAVINGDDARAWGQRGRSPAARALRYGLGPEADVRVVARTPDGLSRSRLQLSLSPAARALGASFDALTVSTPLIGVAGAYAVAAAVASALAIAADRLDPDAIAAALGSLAGEEGRLRTCPGPDGAVLIDDSYNANRASVEASLVTASELARADGRRLVAVLGEMRELGALSASEHRAVGEAAARAGVAVLVAVQGDAAHLADAARRPGLDVLFVPDAAAALDALEARRQPGDVILVKGSRGVGLDRLVAALSSEPEHPAR
ncbi:MAG: UDP-N-acetylmuramoyl-tripeptide--D-alanyl-D-alanine ligase, partial [Myxococcales bacterium]